MEPSRCRSRRHVVGAIKVVFIVVVVRLSWLGRGARRPHPGCGMGSSRYTSGINTGSVVVKTFTTRDRRARYGRMLLRCSHDLRRPVSTTSASRRPAQSMRPYMSIAVPGYKLSKG